MPKILVTGGAGNIGSELSKKLLQNRDNFVVTVDNFFTGNVEKLPRPTPNWKFIKANVNNFNDISSIMVSFGFDYVFHYAALVGVQRTLNNPTMVLDDIQGIRNILDLAKNTGVKRIFFSSSSEVYGEPVEYPQNEDTTPLNSKLPYAIVKNVGEAFLKSYKKVYDLDYTIFRFFNTYGPNQSKDFVIMKFLKMAMAGEPITIYGDGSQTRTFCYVDDNIEATTATLYQDLFINDVVNIGSDHEMTIRELAELIIKLTGSKAGIKQLPPLAEGDMTRRRPDISKMRTILKRDLIGVEDGIKRIIDSLNNTGQ